MKSKSLARLRSHTLCARSQILVSSGCGIPGLVSGQQGLTTARDDMLQDGARTSVHTLSVFHTAGHSATLGTSSISVSASGSSATNAPIAAMCKFLPRHPHTFISVPRLLLLQVRRRMGLEAVALLNFSQRFFFCSEVRIS
jgi:hypothetical protein